MLLFWDRFLENFKSLSELSLLYDADNIAAQIPEIKSSYDEYLQAKVDKIPVQYEEKLQNDYKIY